jgi:hypothetical protein
MVPRCVRLLVACLVVTLCFGAAAQPGGEVPETGPSGSADPKLERAKALFRAGLEFLEQKQTERALELFLRSRALFPSRQNTINAAICLDALERDDEALVLYEAAIADFSAEITPELRAELAPTLDRLRQRVGSVEVSANVNAIVTVDGRERGTLPLLVPLRVLTGNRTIRVIKEGYETFEREVTVNTGSTLRVDARLKPLASAGRLRIVAPSAPGSTVRVDGTTVGTTPWEGTLSPGTHRYEVLQEDLGTGPVPVTVLQGRTVQVEATLKPLGQTIRISVSPPAAALSLDGQRIESGWQGRLTVGPHVLSASSEGYLPGTKSFVVDAKTGGDAQIVLLVDRDHPRWASSTPAVFWFEGFAGYAVAPSLGSGAERCSKVVCNDGETATGLAAGVRAAYEFPFELSIEVAGGYLAMKSTMSRSFVRLFDDRSAGGRNVTYEIDDDVELRGWTATGGIGFRGFFGERFGLQTRIHVGALFGTSSDAMQARIIDSESHPARVVNAGTTESSVSFLVEPEIQAQYRLGAWRIGAGLASLIVPAPGPDNENGDIFPVAECPDMPPTPLPIGCIGGSDVVAEERRFGPFVAFVPGISVGYEIR